MDNYNKDKLETSFSLLFKYILIGDTSIILLLLELF